MQKWMPMIAAAAIWTGGQQGTAAEVQAPMPTKLFYPAADAAADITAALAAAKRGGKHVLLDFGADWCPDCRVLGALFEEATVAPVLRQNFHLVHVDVGRRDRNGALVEQYGATSGDWIPAVVVLDGEGRRIAATDTAVRLTRRTTAAELVARLREWAPKTRTLKLTSLAESGARVTLGLDRDRSGGWWLAAAFEPTAPGGYLYSKDLPPAGIDGLGRPTTFAIATATGLRAEGTAAADRPTTLDVIEVLRTALPVYPRGPVTLRIPVAFAATTAAVTGEAVVSYMVCTPEGCWRPVIGRRASFTIPAGAVRDAR